VSDDPRDVLRDLLREVLSENGHAPVPSVPAPPTAAVLRPSTWTRPAAPGEVIGDGAPPPEAPGGAEVVAISSDADLDRFVRALAARCEDPAERAALRSGARRFTLAGAAGNDMRIESGAVTEKTVKQAAASGARLVLSPRAVLTPLARERARALKVEVERERRW
jgi:hypothetical protein